MSSNNAASLMASLTGDGGGSAGGNENNSSGGDQDLFGDIPIDDPPAPAPAPAPFPQNNNTDNSNNNSDNMSGSVYQDPMGNSYNYPYPQAQQPPNAPNVTYAPDPAANTPAPAPAPAPAENNNNNNNNNSMAQSQPAMPSSPAPAPSSNNMSKSLLMNTGLLGAGNDEKKAEGGGGGLFDDIDQEEEQKAAEEERKRQEQAKAAAEAEAKRQQEEQQRMQQQQQNQQQQQQYSLEARMQGMHLNSGQNSYLQQSQQQQPNQMMNQQGNQGMNPNNNNYGNNQGQGQGQPNQMQGQPNQMNDKMPQQMGNSPNMQQQNNNNMMMSSQQQMGMNPNQNQMMPPNQNQMPQQQQQQPPSHVNVPGIMYRQHPGDMNNPTMSPQQQQPNNASPGNRYYNPSTPANVTAGLHNTQQPSPYGMQQQQQQHPQKRSGPMQITKPPEVRTYYGKVTVSDPMLLQSPSGFLGMVSSPPHWSYQFTTQIKGQPPSVWMVRRRFRHVVALEDRLRTEVPGAILPPRPDKHVSRALEEASTHQSAEFAHQRAAELERYLNALVAHPEVFASQALKMFLGLQDDMGTAWPEVSGNAFTRMSAMGSSAAANLTTSGAGFFGGGATAAPASTTPNQSGGVMSGVMGSVANSVGVGELTEAATEDSAELLALSSSESVRMGAILQAVPKLDGAVTLLREQGEVAGAVGMELNRLAKEVMSQGDRELSMPLEIFSNGLLRYGRRTKRLGQEIGQATMTSFQLQYKLCRYEKLAWSDRRNALTRRIKERGKADKQAQMLMYQQHQYGQQGGYGGYGGQPQMNQYNGGNMNHMMSNATMSDNMAVEAVRQCDEIGERLKREVNRISFSRRMDWAKSVKLIASYMKEAASERVAIWESTRDTFLQAFPDYHNDTAQWTNVAPRPPAQQQQQPNMQQSSMQSPMQSPMQPQMQPQMNMNMNSSYMGSQGGMGGGMSQSYQQPQQQPQQAYNSMMNSAMPNMQQGQQAPMVGSYQQQQH